MERNNKRGKGIGASECCMCGDYGLSSHLFRCKNCQFRYQHRYCSSLYPEAKSYSSCNWCLSQKKDKKIKGVEVNAKLCSLPKSSPPPPPSSHHKTPNIDHMMIKMTKIKRTPLGNHNNKGSLENKKVPPPSDQQPQMIESGKEFRADRPGPTSAIGRNRVMINHRGGIGKMIITRRSQEMSKVGGNHEMIVKKVFRHKVRRYKLLDEVSS